MVWQLVIDYYIPTDVGVIPGEKHYMMADLTDGRGVSLSLGLFSNRKAVQSKV